MLLTCFLLIFVSFFLAFFPSLFSFSSFFFFFFYKLHPWSNPERLWKEKRKKFYSKVLNAPSRICSGKAVLPSWVSSALIRETNATLLVMTCVVCWMQERVKLLKELKVRALVLLCVRTLALNRLWLQEYSFIRHKRKLPCGMRNFFFFTFRSFASAVAQLSYRLTFWSLSRILRSNAVFFSFVSHFRLYYSRMKGPSYGKAKFRSLIVCCLC